MNARLLVSTVVLNSTLFSFAGDDPDEEISKYRQQLTEASWEVRSKGLSLHLEHFENQKWATGRDAFIELIKRGKPGWEAICGLTYDLDWRGDVARSVGTAFRSDLIPPDKLEGFLSFRKEEHEERVRNETWALLYAKRHSECNLDDGPEGKPPWWHEMRLIEAFLKVSDDPEHALVPLSFLRLHFSDDSEFPGHKHPWYGTKQQQSISLELIAKWCTEKRDDRER